MATTQSKKQPSQRMKRMTSGSSIRFEPVSGRRTYSRSKNLLTADVHPVSNFFGFLKEYAVVGLIVGFVLGNQIQAIIKQLIESFIDPLTKLLFGTELSRRAFVLHFHNRSASFGWGAMVYILIIFLFVMITIYIAIKLLNLESERTKKSN